MPKKTLLIALTAAALALGAGGYLYLNKGKTPAAPEEAGEAVEKLAEDAAQGVLPAIGANPLESKPEMNPVEKGNPFNSVKINPFE